MQMPPFNSIWQTPSFPTQTWTCGGSKAFCPVFTTKRNYPSTATVGVNHPPERCVSPCRRSASSRSLHDTP